MVSKVAWIIPLIPLLGALVILARGRRLPGEGAYVGIASIGTAAVLAFVVLAEVIGGTHFDTHVVWAKIGDLTIDVGYNIDPLASMMLALVGVIATLVQVYSVGYMHGDPRYPRFFAYLSMFSAAMLLLIIANSFLLLFIAWELVGVMSYLLIGFWFEKPSATAAQMKAFMTTRVGDIFMFIGIMMVFNVVGSFLFEDVFHAVEEKELAGVYLTVAAVMIFGGAIGKSAQFPLHVWLPDAMEGPTPVSALIHSATMVAAGVYMVARIFPVFHASHEAMIAVAYIGGFTALFAATIAVAQNDIKRILAYSTVSQLGFMMLALGVGGYSTGVFHMFTQAVFKSLLFLGSGSVIHAMHTNDIKEMGGLRKVMPITTATFIIGGLGLAGVPPFAGFWSKDEILLEVFLHDKFLFGMGITAAFFTAFYTARCIFYTFFGEQRGQGHPHESPKSMTVPLISLAIGTSTVGFLGAPFIHQFQGFIHLEHAEKLEVNIALMVGSILVALGGIFLAALTYYWHKIDSEKVRKAINPIYQAWLNKYWLDELYYALFVKPGLVLGNILWTFDRTVVDGTVNLVGWLGRALASIQSWMDKWIVDGLVNLAGGVTYRLGGTIRYTQTGFLQNYLVWIAAGVVVLLVIAAGV